VSLDEVQRSVSSRQIVGSRSPHASYRYCIVGWVAAVRSVRNGPARAILADESAAAAAASARLAQVLGVLVKHLDLIVVERCLADGPRDRSIPFLVQVLLFQADE
jgi:hypothetical protein